MDQCGKAKCPIGVGLTSSKQLTTSQPPLQSQEQTTKDHEKCTQETGKTQTRPIAVGDRLEVQWVLEVEPQEEEETKEDEKEEGDQPVENEVTKEEALAEQPTDQTTTTNCTWWPCEVMSLEGQHVLVDTETQDSEACSIFKLKYDPDESVGWQEAEETKCIFVGANRMMDLSYSDSLDCNAFLFYRREGEKFEPPPDGHNSNESDVTDDTTTTTASSTTAVPHAHDEQMQVLAGQDSHTAAEEIADQLLRPLMQKVQQRGLSMMVQHRVAERLSELREKSIALIEKRFKSGDDLTLAVANEIIEELKPQLEAGNNKRPRLV
eukprot:m.89151 g.89151  ORF g.89151 m.89151 type:complete len:322 (+) comp26267_c0_seq1:131-1096(+)